MPVPEYMSIESRRARIVNFLNLQADVQRRPPFIAAWRRSSSTLRSIANLAWTYRSEGGWNEAEELDVSVMETAKRVLGDEHPDTLTSMANFVSASMNQKQ